MDKPAKASRLLSEGGKGERRLSMFEKDRHAQILKGRMRNSSHEVHGMEPMDGESFAEFGKSEIFTLKTSMAKIKYANTYKMEPYRKFQAHLVRNKAQHILTRLQKTKYNGATSVFLCNSISEEILRAVKDMGFDRYKYVVTVLILQKTGQEIKVSRQINLLIIFSQTELDVWGPIVPLGHTTTFRVVQICIALV
ncbi:dynein light chain Tctex-type protein 2 isoform X2 [Dermochelys coriacea]|uniref:dynein light chain Tctex-type protein 2 isoform X2 n=1 Tax=Dermochelys coriacea TaxID=27794 RepID=UPI0018E805CC|nr:dynein light chain Tctex-type protein 2 isoform X2 [Dermochelys coriacea]